MPRPSRLAALALVLATAVSCVAEDSDEDPSPTPTVTAGPVNECSAQDMDVDEPEDLGTLDTAAASTRTDIVAAARACDYEELQELARQHGETFAFGDRGVQRGVDVQPGVWWRDRETQGDEVMERLVVLLSLRWSTAEGLTAEEAAGADQDVTVYVWPRAWNVEESEDADWKALEQIYPAVDVAGWRSGGRYGGERVMITEQGRWLAFAQVG